MDTMQGGCLCGAVRFEARPPSLFLAHCHCVYCRRAHGAAFVTWLGVREDRFRLLAGDAALRWYASSAASRRGFCAVCGSTLFFASTLCPGELHIARALLDGDPDLVPELHCFWDQHVDWATCGDTLPRYDSTHPGLARYRAVAPLAR